MRHDLLDILACPLCKGALTLTAAREAGGEVIEGALHCTTCTEDYPIVDGIPNLLPPDLRRAMEAETRSGGARPSGH
ncbi:MAG: Trm112 family protein [Dehalococcoidia bacterium]|nr:Trm112 family protein [Dehalococcoidia bacterium]